MLNDRFAHWTDLLNYSYGRREALPSPIHRTKQTYNSNAAIAALGVLNGGLSHHVGHVPWYRQYRQTQLATTTRVMVQRWSFSAVAPRCSTWHMLTCVTAAHPASATAREPCQWARQRARCHRSQACCPRKQNLLNQSPCGHCGPLLQQSWRCRYGAGGAVLLLPRSGDLVAHARSRCARSCAARSRAGADDLVGTTGPTPGRWCSSSC